MTQQYKTRIDRALREIESVDGITGYEYQAPSNKLRRNKADGILGGVCAGIGDYVGLDAIIVRIIFVLLVVFTGFPLFIYFILWIFIPADDRREVPARTSPTRDVNPTFQPMETRLQDLERSIASKEWQLRRDFRELEAN